MPRWFKEIRKVGLRDWLWFVVLLRRNEFHRRLDLSVAYYRCSTLEEQSEYLKQLSLARRRAHRVDMALSD